MHNFVAFSKASDPPLILLRTNGPVAIYVRKNDFCQHYPISTHTGA
jgi:hypothetical protein